MELLSFPPLICPVLSNDAAVSMAEHLMHGESGPELTVFSLGQQSKLNSQEQ